MIPEKHTLSVSCSCSCSCSWSSSTCSSSSSSCSSSSLSFFLHFWSVFPLVAGRVCNRRRVMLVPQVCLKWNVQRGVPVIPRSQNPKNIKANIDGIFDWVLPRAAKVHFASHAFHCPMSGIGRPQAQVAKLAAFSSFSFFYFFFFFRHVFCNVKVRV